MGPKDLMVHNLYACMQGCRKPWRSSNLCKLNTRRRWGRLGRVPLPHSTGKGLLTTERWRSYGDGSPETRLHRKLTALRQDWETVGAWGVHWGPGAMLLRRWGAIVIKRLLVCLLKYHIILVSNRMKRFSKDLPFTCLCPSIRTCRDYIPCSLKKAERNDRHDLCELSISLWEFIWRF